MLFTWLKRKRRREVLAGPMPPSWLNILQQDVAFYVTLAPEEQTKLCADLRVFIAEKRWEGCGGLEITDRVKVVIAAQACLLLLGLKHDFFAPLHTILVYPQAFVDACGEKGFDGVVTLEPRLGEAWYRGPVVLSWADVLAGALRDDNGRNVVIHEFAHQFDMLDAFTDTGPPRQRRRRYQQSQRVMRTEYERLVRQSRQGQATLLDSYGAANEAEFFAVATECFFEQGGQMRARHRPLYDVLRQCYGQDPASRYEEHRDSLHF